MLDCIATDAQLARPFGYGQALSTPFDEIRQSTISVLFERVCPSTILRRISESIVDAVYGVSFGRTWTHVSVERLERFAPSSADNKTDSAVSRIQRVLRIRATLNDVRPNAVFVGPVKSVPSMDCRENISRKASAGSDLSLFQVGRSDLRNFAALATTEEPHGCSFPRRGLNPFHHRQPAKCLSSAINGASSHIAHC